jgi:hypothetical protein
VVPARWLSPLKKFNDLSTKGEQKTENTHWSLVLTSVVDPDRISRTRNFRPVNLELLLRSGSRCGTHEKSLESSTTRVDSKTWGFAVFINNCSKPSLL